MLHEVNYKDDPGGHHLELDQRQPFDGSLYYTGPGSLAQWVTGATHTAKE